jgi:cell shape-determining protein MreD
LLAQRQIAHLFPIYRRAYTEAPLLGVGVRFGILMGVVFDALQGGIIEYATFRMPFIVFVVDSSYHVFVEGSVAGLLLALCYRKFGSRR